MALANTTSTAGSSSLSSALAQLRIKLLDLTGRNRLINFKHTAGKSLQFVEGQPSAVYEKLTESSIKPTISILGLPEPLRRDWIEQNGRLQRPEPREWARSQNISTSFDIGTSVETGAQSNIRALMYPDDLAKHCRKIEREAVLAIEETGANMLFLVLGFLEFPDQRDSTKSLTAPLICIPVSLQKKEASGIQSFSLQFTGDDISENLSLREKLKNDFGLILPELDEDQIDVESYFQEIQKIINLQPGFAIKRRVSICLLSFSNMLLVRDLDPTKWPQIGELNSLVDHPIVREVFEGTADTGGQGISLAQEHQVEDGPGASIPLVYDADSSQHSALIDVLVLKKNLVIEGPPGTGKSQTITNLIAASLAQGKKVLFVAEKLAALEVVKNRLSMAGLDPFVLELHSNKTNKKRVLEEIEKRISYQPTNPHDLPKLQQQLESHRADLKTYSDLINSVAHNSFGLTLHQVMWRAEKFRSALTADEAHLSQISIKDGTHISEFELSRRMDCLDHLSAQYTSVGGFDYESTFWGFFPKRLIPGEEFQIKTLLESTLKSASTLVSSSESLVQILGGNVIGLNLGFCNEQREVLTNLLDISPQGLPFDLVPHFFPEDDISGNNTKGKLTAFQTQINQFHAALADVMNALLRESSATENVVGNLKNLLKSANLLGVELGTTQQIVDNALSLSEQATKLNAALQYVTDFTQSKSIPFDGTRSRLAVFAEFTKLIINVPEEHLHLQTPGLMRDDAIAGLEKLAESLEEWTSLESYFSGYLYLDALPSDEDIKQAIRTLREGDAWYRIFQSKWRSAVSLHKSMQKQKTKVTAYQRLDQLEQVINMLKIHESWKSDAAWTQILGISPPIRGMSLVGYLALAKWNRSIKIASEELQVNLIDLSTLNGNQARALRREFLDLEVELSSVEDSIKLIDVAAPRIQGFIRMQIAENVVSTINEFLDTLAPELIWLQTEAQQSASVKDVIASCEAALSRSALTKVINDNTYVKALLGKLFKGTDTDVTSALEVLAIGQSIDGLNLSAQVKAKLKGNSLLLAAEQVQDALNLVAVGLTEVDTFSDKLSHYGEFNFKTWVGAEAEEDLTEFAELLVQELENSIDDIDIVIPWSLYIARRDEAFTLELNDFVSMLEDKKMPAKELSSSYGYCCYSTITREAFNSIPQLGRFTGLRHNQIRDEFKRVDKEIISLRGKAIGYECSRQANTPYGHNGSRVDDKTEMVLLNYLLPQQRPRMPVRKMLMRAGASVQALKPCFMMGPQAVAQYLTPGAIKFDLVIMDEASQLRPEEAIGAIARGGQLVVVGDPKQLPPTSFFSRMNQSGDDDEQFTTTDAESILDVCSSHFQPTRSLRWHYRSQHHSLIAFSNLNFYRSNLVIFPSPYGQGGKLGVKAVYLADAVYENQTNLREAKRVIDAVVEHISSRPEESVGVVTLNIKQRDLIAELLDERLKSIKGADKYREHWRAEGQPIFIKNLENVQGDERDAIIISTTFGKPAGSSAVRQNFGPISRQGGWRRLNVLFTRAKRSVAIYTSLRPEDIVSDASTPEGTKALRNYLEYARTGSLTVAEETGHEPDSDFEISVMDVLRTRGYEVTPQLGVAGYRIDIAVKHPDALGSYLAAIECDGASYHSALSVRDRDRIRQEVLEALGWRGRIWRIWSTDWFRTPRQETDKLISFLDGLRNSWKPEHSTGESWIEEGQGAKSSGSNSTPSTAAEVIDPQGAIQAQIEREAVSSALIDSEEDLEIEVGDVVRYIDLTKPQEIQTVQITSGKDDFANGIVNETRPLAQALLGAVVGDQISLNFPGTAPRVLQITDIKRT